jgi:hypothetical protein
MINGRTSELKFAENNVELKDTKYKCDAKPDNLENVLCELVIRKYRNSLKQYQKTGELKLVEKNVINDVSVENLKSNYGVEFSNAAMFNNYFDNFSTKKQPSMSDDKYFKDEFESNIFK